MKNIRVAHEAPKSIFKMVQELTDYDYFLVHLFEEDPEYLQLAKDAVAAGREVILDNSIFELGEAFSAERFAKWVNELKPTYYIVPDALEDADTTILNMKRWLKNYKDQIDPRCKMIGVVQGKTYRDIVRCYKFMDKVADVDKIAISFDYSLYEELVPHHNRYVSWMLGRVALLGKLEKDGVINESKPHHLLGCGLPQEFKFYNQEWIDSCDTSNPVVHGIKYIQYENEGLFSKESVKLYTLMNYELSDVQKGLVEYNIHRFKSFCNRIIY